MIRNKWCSPPQIKMWSYIGVKYAFESKYCRKLLLMVCYKLIFYCQQTTEHGVINWCNICE
jgi:hypothetical protein